MVAAWKLRLERQLPLPIVEGLEGKGRLSMCTLESDSVRRVCVVAGI